MYIYIYIHIYIYIYIHMYTYKYIYYIIAEKAIYFLRRYAFSKKLIYLCRKSIFRSTIWLLPRKLIIWFANIIFSFGNITFPRTFNYLLRECDIFDQNNNASKKVTYVLRKHDLFNQEYAKVTPKWDELFLNAFWGSSLTNSFPKGAP